MMKKQDQETRLRRKDGGRDGGGGGFYFRNATELILSGIRGKNAQAWRDTGQRLVEPKARALA